MERDNPFGTTIDRHSSTEEIVQHVDNIAAQMDQIIEENQQSLLSYAAERDAILVRQAVKAPMTENQQMHRAELLRSKKARELAEAHPQFSEAAIRRIFRSVTRGRDADYEDSEIRQMMLNGDIWSPLTPESSNVVSMAGYSLLKAIYDPETESFDVD